MIRVLIVEDSVTQREILKMVVEANLHCEVVGQASDGRQAVRMARGLNPDVVLMDVNMPDMNGIEATREIMAESPVPFVILSSLLHQRDVIGCSREFGWHRPTGILRLAVETEWRWWNRILVMSIAPPAIRCSGLSPVSLARKLSAGN